MAITWDEFGNEINVEDTGQNQVKEDQGAPTNPNNPDVKAAANEETSTPSATNAAEVSNAGTTVAGKSGSTTIKAASQSKSPTVRPNPLGYLSSYTYQLTLYMLTPDALNAFRASGRRNISNLTTLSAGGRSGGAYIVAQSGGVNNSTSQRAPGMNLDYYIDNVQLTHLVSPNENMAPTVSTKISFNIFEPYGFSFLSRLKIASDTLEQYTKTLNIKELTNSSRQFFVLGIRFQGYDRYGNLLTGKETIDGRVIDPAGSGNGLFETFYEILFTKVNFKIDGKATTYNIEAVSLGADSLKIMNATIPSQVTVEASTVEEALTGKSGLITLINNFYQKTKLDIKPKFSVEFIGDFNDLKNAKIVLPSDTTKWKWPMISSPDDKIGLKAIPNSDRRQMSFSNTPSMSIITAMEKIFTQSSFLENALKQDYTNEVSSDPQTDKESIIKPDSPQYLRWFNITTNTKIIGYSKQESRFIYDTTFIVTPYETPVVLSTYAKKLPKYYGPVKRYEYWFTGKNTEIINYEQTNNNGYFLVSLDPNVDDKALNQIAKSMIFKQNADSTGTLYAGNEARGSITTNLYDPKSYSSAKITILGDPDFLVQDSLNYDAVTKAFNQFFAPNGTTINPTGGQIFVEIDFKEGVDYNYNTGVMDINESITFWQYPESIKKLIKGVSFQVRKITSNFKGGKFTQDLDMFINQLSEDIVVAGSNITGIKATSDVNGRINENQSDAETARLLRQNGARPGTGSPIVTGGDTTSSTNVGLKQEPEVADNTQPPPTPESNQSPDEPGTTAWYDAGSEEDGGREEG